MNILIANQYGRVQGGVGGTGLTLAVSAQTPRRESVQLQTRIDSVEQLLHLLAIMRAVERRIEQFQLRDAKAPQPAESDGTLDESICTEGELFTSNGNSKNKIYGRFAQFLVYEQVDQAGYGSSLEFATRRSAWPASICIPARCRHFMPWRRGLVRH